MFERRTVFIVGAGASREIRFPMGAELTGIIADKLHIGSRDGWSLSSGDKKVIAAVRHRMGLNGENDANPYYAAGRAIAAGMSQAISIDNYLHAHAGDELVTWMGKLGIAASILEAERGSQLAINDHDAVNLSAVSNSWYTPFFQMATEGVQRSALEGIFDNVAFITFNYDRCIEHYLMHAIVNYFRIDPKEAQALVNRLRIKHPYGQVGRMPWQIRSGSTSFGREFQGHELPEIAAQIRTFTEQVDHGEMLQRAARMLISEAEVVVYLGFSYGDMNMQLLSDDEARERAIFGTSFGVSAPNKKAIESDIVNSMGPSSGFVKTLELADLTCVDFLRAYWKPIMRGL